MSESSPVQIGTPRGVGALASLACGLVHGLLCYLSQPSPSIWALSFAAVMPLVLVITRSRLKPRWAALLAALGTLPYWAWTQRWVIEITDVGYGPMLLLQAFWTWLFVWTSMRIVSSRVGRLVGAALVIPVVWTGVEFFRCEVAFTGYAWGVLAYPLIESVWLSSPAALLGVFFVSFLVCVPSGALAEFLLHRSGSRVRALATMALAVLAWMACAIGRPGFTEANVLRVGVVQTNLPQDNKLSWSFEHQMSDFERFLELTTQAAGDADRPDLIVWPETMVPGGTLAPEALAKLRRDQIVRHATIDGRDETFPATWFADRLLERQHSLAIPMLVGAEGVDGFDVRTERDGSVHLSWKDRYNSVFEIDRGAIQPTRYDKGRLTPFGEFFPYIRHWPWLQSVMLDAGAHGMSFNLSEGTGREVFQIPAGGVDAAGTVRIVTPICFEVTHAGFMRGLVYEDGRRRVDAIVSPTNDGWFGISNEGREHHLLMARWRCVELNVPMVRAANTGVSAFIDASGRVLGRGVGGNAKGCQVDGVLGGRLAIDPAARATLYGRIGNSLGWACLLAASAGALASLAGGRLGSQTGSKWSGKR